MYKTFYHVDNSKGSDEGDEELLSFESESNSNDSIDSINSKKTGSSKSAQTLEESSTSSSDDLTESFGKRNHNKKENEILGYGVIDDDEIGSHDTEENEIGGYGNASDEEEENEMGGYGDVGVEEENEMGGYDTINDKKSIQEDPEENEITGYGVQHVDEEEEDKSERNSEENQIAGYGVVDKETNSEENQIGGYDSNNLDDENEITGYGVENQSSEDANEIGGYGNASDDENEMGGYGDVGVEEENEMGGYGNVASDEEIELGSTENLKTKFNTNTRGHRKSKSLSSKTTSILNRTSEDIKPKPVVRREKRKLVSSKIRRIAERFEQPNISPSNNNKSVPITSKENKKITPSPLKNNKNLPPTTTSQKQQKVTSRNSPLTQQRIKEEQRKNSQNQKITTKPQTTTKKSDDNNKDDKKSSSTDNNGNNNNNNNNKTPLGNEVLTNAGCYWNTEFQRALDMDEGRAQWTRLAKLAHDFVYCSKTYGKIIITEYYLPESEKTIKSVIDAGGVAGGSKYICSNIFFKFALDTDLTEETRKKKNLTKEQLPSTWMYGGSQPDDYAAMKASKNDMTGLMSYYNAKIPGLYFPLMALIDYRGFRLIAMSILPISKSTIRYGSADAGKTIHKANKEINTKMQEAAEILNLKGHRTGTGRVMIYGPGDIEAHEGKDNKFYVVDFGRTFPPEAPSEPGSRKIFYCLLRPEFVRMYHKPLSSDAFSCWGRCNSKIHNQEVREATQYLYDVIIPKFADELYKKKSNVKDIRLTESLHSSGINCRHIGRVRKALQQYGESAAGLSKLLMTEMVARLLSGLLKQLLRIEMKKTKIASQEPYKTVVIDFLNSILQTTPTTNTQKFENSIMANPILSDDPRISFRLAPDQLHQIANENMGEGGGNISGGGNKHLFNNDVIMTNNNVGNSNTTGNTLQQSSFPSYEDLNENFSFKSLREVESCSYLRRCYFWTSDIKEWLETKFTHSLKDNERNRNYNLRDSIDIKLLLRRLCYQSGIKLSKPAMNEFDRHPKDFQVLNFDLKKVSARVKHLNIIDEAEGNLLFIEARNHSHREGLWDATNQKFARAVCSNTNNPSTFVRWGSILLKQCNHFRSSSKSSLDNNNYTQISEKLLEEAEEKFHSALKLNPRMHQAKFELGNTFVFKATVIQLHKPEDTIALSLWNLEEATRCYYDAFSSNPCYFQKILLLADEMSQQAKNIRIPLSAEIRSELYLRGFFMIHCAISVSPIIPESSVFAKGAILLKDYLVCGGNPSMGDYIYGLAGSYLESAFLKFPSLSDGHLIYYHQKSLYHTQKNGTQSNLSTLHKNNDQILIYSIDEQSKLNNFPTCSFECEMNDIIDTNHMISSDFPISFYPIISEDPSSNYHQVRSINRLFHLLGCIDSNKIFKNLNNHPNQTNNNNTSINNNNSSLNPYNITSQSQNTTNSSQSSSPQSSSPINNINFYNNSITHNNTNINNTNINNINNNQSINNKDHTQIQNNNNPSIQINNSSLSNNISNNLNFNNNNDNSFGFSLSLSSSQLNLPSINNLIFSPSSNSSSNQNHAGSRIGSSSNIVRFQNSDCTFVLAHSPFHAFSLTSVHILLPVIDSSLRNVSLPSKISLFGSNCKSRLEFTKENLTKAIHKKDQQIRARLNMFLIHTENINSSIQNYGKIIDISIPSSINHARYLILDFTPDYTSNTKEVALSKISFKGHQYHLTTLPHSNQDNHYNNTSIAIGRSKRALAKSNVIRGNLKEAIKTYTKNNQNENENENEQKDKESSSTPSSSTNKLVKNQNSSSSTSNSKVWSPASIRTSSTRIRLTWNTKNLTNNFSVDATGQILRTNYLKNKNSSRRNSNNRLNPFSNTKTTTTTSSSTPMVPNNNKMMDENNNYFSNYNVIDEPKIFCCQATLPVSYDGIPMPSPKKIPLLRNRASVDLKNSTNPEISSPVGPFITVWIDNNHKSNETRTLCQLARNQSPQLDIIKCKSVSEATKWLKEADNDISSYQNHDFSGSMDPIPVTSRSLEKLIRSQSLRVVFSITNNSKPKIKYSIIEALSISDSWKLIPILIFNSTTNPIETNTFRHDDERLIFTSNCARSSVEFASFTLRPSDLLEIPRNLTGSQQLLTEERRSSLPGFGRSKRTLHFTNTNNRNFLNQSNNPSYTPSTGNKILSFTLNEKSESESSLSSSGSLNSSLSLQNSSSSSSDNNEVELFYYFEITITYFNSKSSLNHTNESNSNKSSISSSEKSSSSTSSNDDDLPLLSIGLSTSDYPNEGTRLGTSPYSYAFQNDGTLWCGWPDKPSKFPNNKFYTFTQNDIIGCGYDARSGQIFWTKNGIYLGPAECGHSKIYDITKKLYPTICISGECNIRANFGKTNFLFQLSKLYSVTNPKLSLSTKNESVCSIHPFSDELFSNCLKRHNMDLLVISLLSQISRTLHLLFRSHIYYWIKKNQKYLFNNISIHLLDSPAFISKIPMIYSDYKKIDLSNTLHRSNELHLCSLLSLIHSHCRISLDISHWKNISSVLFGHIFNPEIIIHLNLTNCKFIDHSSSKSMIGSLIYERLNHLESISLWSDISEHEIITICSINSLHSIDFTNCLNLNDSTIISAFKGKHSSVHYESLNFTNCSNITDNGIIHLSKANSIRSLKSLNLNYCDGISVHGISKILNCCKNLQHIFLATNPSRSGLTDHLVSFIGQKYNQKLQTLVLSRSTDITPASMNIISARYFLFFL